MTDVVTLDAGARCALARRVREQSELIRFDAEPALASLCASVGLQFELGKPAFDRLSPFFGATDLETEIICTDSEFGVRLKRKDGGAFQARHRDLANVIDPSSLDERGELSRIVIFPARVAKTYARKGFELVVVRDWILSSSLAEDDESRVPYLFANEWEIQSNIARTQAWLMTKRRLAFSGTHDIADHLLSADADKFGALSGLFEEARDVLDEGPPSNAHLLVAYFIGVLLDDLAQPRWYGSAAHATAIREALRELDDMAPREVPLAVPDWFHQRVAAIRGCPPAL